MRHGMGVVMGKRKAGLPTLGKPERLEIHPRLAVSGAGHGNAPERHLLAAPKRLPHRLLSRETHGQALPLFLAFKSVAQLLLAENPFQKSGISLGNLPNALDLDNINARADDPHSGVLAF